MTMAGKMTAAATLALHTTTVGQCEQGHRTQTTGAKTLTTTLAAPTADLRRSGSQRSGLGRRMVVVHQVLRLVAGIVTMILGVMARVMSCR